MPFLNNIVRADTWSIAADLNHIVHPLSKPTEAQINHNEPELSDRIGGSVLFAFSMLLIVPACLYLYWASRKVDQIDQPKSDSPEAKADQIIKDTPVFNLKAGENKELNKSETKNQDRIVQEDKKPTPEPKKPTLPLQPILGYMPGYDLPAVTRESLNEIFGNSLIIERIPFHEAESRLCDDYKFPIMKGMSDFGDPYIVIRIVSANPEADYEKYEKAYWESKAQKTAQKGQAVEEIYAELKETALARIRQGVLVEFSSQSLLWEEYFPEKALALEGLESNEFSGFFYYTTPASPYPDNRITDPITGKVLNEAKKCIPNFQQFIATGSTIDPNTGEVWNMVDYEKVKPLLNPSFFHIGPNVFQGFSLEIVQGDLLDQEVDAIVNPANASLAGGGGVDGKIGDAAGQAIYNECLEQLEAKGTRWALDGEAYITGAGNLSKVKHVIHAVGPDWGTPGKEELLRNAYYNSLLRAHEKNLTSIAFPAISIGTFFYPAEEAPKEVWEAMNRFQRDYPDSLLKTVRLVYWPGHPLSSDVKSYKRMLVVAKEESAKALLNKEK